MVIKTKASCDIPPAGYETGIRFGIKYLIIYFLKEEKKIETD